MENKEDLQFKRAESYTSTRKTAGASQRGLTSGREDGRRRGLRERERHVQRRRPDLGASPATAAAACKHEATCKSATSSKLETNRAPSRRCIRHPPPKLPIAAARRARDPVAVDPASSRPKKHETRLGEWEEPGRKTRELRGAARARKETKRFGV